MKKGLWLILCAFFSLVAQANAESFYYEEGFDNPTDYTDGNTIPAGWLSMGTIPMMRYTATDLGLTANSGSYVLGTTPGYSFRDEIVYTQALNLKGGEPCNISFWLLAPGGAAPQVFYTHISVTAGLAQTPEAQTIAIGETEKAACREWKEQAMSFTPETDGLYYVAFKLNSATPSNCGFVALDDIIIEGQSPAEIVESGELNQLEAAYAKEFDTSLTYIYKGEVLVTHIDGLTAYIQDDTAGAHLILPANTTIKTGDKLTDITCKINVTEQCIVLTAENENAGTVVSSGNTLQPAELAAADYIKDVQKYMNRLVKISKLHVKEAEAGDVFEEGISYVFTDGTTEFKLGFFEQNKLIDEEIPTEELTVTGISLSATAAELAPRDKNDFEIIKAPIVHEVMPLPYQQSFDNENGDYDGLSQLPKGWTSTGTYPFVTANIDELPAYDGTYYVISPESTELRDEYLYTPFFEMKQGKTYELSFYLYLPGNSDYSTLRMMNLAVTAGKEQESTTQTKELLLIKDEPCIEWTEKQTTFSPEADGQYCFAFSLSSELNYTGEVAIDLVTVKEQGALVKPKADFTFTSWSDIIDSQTLVFEGQPVSMVNLSTDATDYEWKAEGATPSVSTEENPQFTFEKEGTYTIALTAKNSKYSKTTYKEIHVKFPVDGANMGLLNYTVADDKNLTAFTEIPTFSTDETYDFVSGFNHYYRRMAERFELPEEQELTLTSINFWMVAYSRMMTYRPEDRNFPFTIAVYGETDGKLDENKLFGKKVSTLAEEFGDMGIGLEHPKMWMFELPEPIKVKGTYYLALEFDDKMPIESNDPNITRSYVALGLIEHKSMQTSMYVKPTDGPDGFTPTDEWCKLDELDSSLKGLGLYFVVWADINKNGTGMIALNSNGEICLAARADNGMLTVSGTQKNESVCLFDIHGKMIKQIAGRTDSTSFSVANVPTGIYIVKTAHGTVKVQL